MEVACARPGIGTETENPALPSLANWMNPGAWANKLFAYRFVGPFVVTLVHHAEPLPFPRWSVADQAWLMTGVEVERPVYWDAVDVTCIAYVGAAAYTAAWLSGGPRPLCKSI